MRIACIHIPQYALQCATRIDPSLRGSGAVAMVDAQGPAPRIAGSGPLHAPVVVACSRAAWALGVRLGMTATAVRSIAAEVSIVGVDPVNERETVRAIADALLGITPIVDLGGRVGAGGAHLALYAEVPQKTRGHSFGDKVLERLAQLGLTGRIGIADDRFTAWVAAAYGPAAEPVARGEQQLGLVQRTEDHGVVTMVPRGGSAAFLAPRPLSLLAISPEVQHMLEALGVRTLGEFAALPAPSVARPLEADYRALARGESGTHLRPYAPDAAIREELVVTAGNVLDGANAVSGPTAIAQVARRIALRLDGRGRAAARLELAAITSAGVTVLAPELAELALGPATFAAQAELPGHVDAPATPSLTSAEELARAFAPILDAVAAAEAWRLRVTVTGEAVTTVDEHDVAVTTELAMRAPVGVVDGAVVRDVAALGSGAIAAHASIGRVASAGGTSAAHGTSRIAAVHTASSSSSRAAHLSYGAQPAHEPRGIRPANSNEGSSPLAGATPDPLAVVLSTSGALFALTPGQPDRAERAHRRTRRGKQRRSRSMTAPVQARLFDRR